MPRNNNGIPPVTTRFKTYPNETAYNARKGFFKTRFDSDDFSVDTYEDYQEMVAIADFETDGGKTFLNVTSSKELLKAIFA